MSMRKLRISRSSFRKPPLLHTFCRMLISSLTLLHFARRVFTLAMSSSRPRLLST